MTGETSSRLDHPARLHDLIAFCRIQPIASSTHRIVTGRRGAFGDQAAVKKSVRFRASTLPVGHLA